MSNLEAIEAIYRQVTDAFVKAHDLMTSLEAEGLSLEAAKEIQKKVDHTLAALHDTEGRLKVIGQRMGLCQAYQYEARSLLYVICRETKDLGSPLTWDEIAEARRSSGWDWSSNAFVLLDVARRTRDRHNAHANDVNRKDRGFRPGHHTWQIWAYKSQDNSWTLAE